MHLPIAAVLVLAAGAAAAPEPRYVVEPCCNLCPQAAYRSAYNTKFLESLALLVQGEDGWLFRSDDLRTSFGPDAEGYRDLRRFRDALKARGTELVVVYQPTRALMHLDKLPPNLRRSYRQDLARVSYGLTLQRFRNAGLIVPNLTQLLAPDGGPPYFFRADHHWTPHGARRTAQIVAETIRSMPVYAALPKSTFATERTGLLAKKGSMHKAAAQICGFGYPEQFVDRYETAAIPSSGLFDETAVPQIVLMGTSNSDSAYNFAGFLSDLLNVDILNESITGGRHDGSLLQYLPSPEFQKNPPKIMIWEFQTNHNLSQKVFYRQVVPLVTNGCRSRTPVLSNKAALRGPRTEVLINGRSGTVLPLRGKHYLLDVQYDDPTVSQMDAVIWYTNGSRETLKLKYSSYVNGRGRFVAELRDDEGWGERTFLALDMALPEGVRDGIGVSAQLCARDNAPGQRQAAK